MVAIESVAATALVEATAAVAIEQVGRLVVAPDPEATAQLKATLPVKPPDGVTAMDAVLLDPAVRVTLAGVGTRVKPGPLEAPALVRSSVVEEG